MNKLSKAYLIECQKALDLEQEESLASSNNWDHVDRDLIHRDWDNLYQKLVIYIGSIPVENENVQQLIKKHYQIACRFYTPSKEAYIGMAMFYKNNEEMKAFHNSYHPGMVDYLADAMISYATKSL